MDLVSVATRYSRGICDWIWHNYGLKLYARNECIAFSNRFRQYTRLQEALFWGLVVVAGYGIYLLLTAV